MNISSEAMTVLKEHLETEDSGNKAIRFFSVQGCCGPSIQMILTDEKEETDESFFVDGIEFRISGEIRETLLDTTLMATDRGFKIEGLPSSKCC